MWYKLNTPAKFLEAHAMTLWGGIESEKEILKRYVADSAMHLMELNGHKAVTFAELLNEVSKYPLFVTEVELKTVLKDMVDDLKYEALLDRIIIRP